MSPVRFRVTWEGGSTTVDEEGLSDFLAKLCREDAAEFHVSPLVYDAATRTYSPEPACTTCGGTRMVVGRADGATDGVFTYERPCPDCT